MIAECPKCGVVRFGATCPVCALRDRMDEASEFAVAVVVGGAIVAVALFAALARVVSRE